MPIDQWWNFFYLCGSAAVTLTGLTFVAVTLGVTIIKTENMDKVNVFFSPICFHFLHIFFLCCLTDIPGASPQFIAGRRDPKPGARVAGALLLELKKRQRKTRSATDMRCKVADAYVAAPYVKL
jgi:hypothetical protein